MLGNNERGDGRNLHLGDDITICLRVFFFFSVYLFNNHCDLIYHLVFEVFFLFYQHATLPIFIKLCQDIFHAMPFVICCFLQVFLTFCLLLQYYLLCCHQSCYQKWKQRTTPKESSYYKGCRTSLSPHKSKSLRCFEISVASNVVL